MRLEKKWALLSAALALMTAGSVHAETTQVIRWTANEDADGSLNHVIQALSEKLGRQLTREDFLLQEDRDLAFNHYKRLAQVVDGLPVHGKSLRIWTELGSDRVVQVEAAIEAPKTFARSLHGLKALDLSAQELAERLSSERTSRLARAAVKSHRDDPFVRGIAWNDEWLGSDLVRSVKVRGKRGKHLVRISLTSRKVVSHAYEEFPQADMPWIEAEQEIPVSVYPIYEEAEGAETPGVQLPRVPAALKHVRSRVPLVEGDIYAPLKTQRYLESTYDPVLGETEEGRAQGYWSPRYVKEQAAKLRAGLPTTANDFKTGLLLQGRYATINLHPEAVTRLAPFSFEPKFSSPLFPNWVDTVVDGQAMAEMVLGNAYVGKPITSVEEALGRPARRLPNHDPKSYLEDGFDEIQVYYAVNTLFEELQGRGFTDPELSSRPFDAFLFNPDISYRDNAYYTDDTINFTTYSPTQPNMARDNPTIWHELGHGVMDRLMGDQIQLADTGGLSEGMADFVAQIVVQAKTDGKPFPGSDKFRIDNKTGFHLTNEVHDDGEAYGGAMKDFMDAVIARNGRKGLHQVADVVLEGMRLSRDYPGLTAPEWFNHVLFADSLGRPGLRAPGELKGDLLAALAGRNFKLDGGNLASFSLANGEHEVVSGQPGSRQSPILVPLAENASARFELKASVKGSEAYSFKFPVRVRVQFRGAPIQGAVHWNGEEDGAREYTLGSEAEVASIPLEVAGKCDEANRDDGSCVDYAYVQVWNAGDATKPVAKKRFYLRVKTTKE